MKWSLWLLLAGWLLLALAWGTLHAWILPRIGEFRPALENRASAALGIPVRIGAIEARSEGLIPSFELREVVLSDAQGRTALRLPRVLAALSPQSLWNFGFEQLYLDSPELEIRRDAAGHIHVAGLDMSRSSGSDPSDGQAADWFFSQPEFVIRNATVRWTDEVLAAPALELREVDFVSRNHARQHALRLDATPPSDWGARFTLAGIFRQPLLSRRAGRWEDWSGQLYAEFAQVDLSQLRQYATPRFQIKQGRGALRAWSQVEQGRFAGVTADVALAEVQAELGAKLEPLALRSVAGRVGGERLANGFHLETQGLQFETREGQRWPGGDVWLTWTDAEAKAPARGEFRADKLDMAALSQIAHRLPLGAATHEALAAYAPRGMVESIEARWQGPLAAPEKYQARGRAFGVEIAGRPRGQGAGSPGIRAAQVEFDLTEAGGKARLEVQHGALEFPGVFEEPVLPFDRLSADLKWQVRGQEISAALENLQFANADAQGEGRATWRTSDPGASGASGARSRFPGILDLHASISRADGARVWRYLPAALPQKTREYVRDSVLQGQASGARFRVKGDLHEFPFRDGRSGEFLITTQVRDAVYAYVPESLNRGPGAWPALTQLSGELVFTGSGMQVKNASGQFAGAPGLRVKAEVQIPDFRTPTVVVNGTVNGPLPEQLRYVAASPVAAITSHALDKARAVGDADLRLDLQLPLQDLTRTEVKGKVTLSGNELQFTPETPVLTQARGAVTFDERGFQLVDTQARALGGEVKLEGGMRPPAAGQPPVTQVRANGVITADGLRQAKELGFLSRLGRQMKGSTGYTMTLRVRRHGVPEVLVASTLRGMALSLPEPLNKPADEALPLRFETALTRESLAGGIKQDQLSLELGRIVSVAYVRDLSGAVPRPLRGGIAVGLEPEEALALPEDGVSANINLARLSVEAWRQALGETAGTAAPAAPAEDELSASSASAAPEVVMSYLPTAIAVRAQELSAQGHSLHNIVAGGTRDGRTWRANVDARELSGYLEYRQPSGAGAGRVRARLARLVIADSQTGEVESALAEQPFSIPALDVVVDDFELKGRKLGRLEIDAVNKGPGAVVREGGIREWRLNRLALTTPEARFSASGNWAAVDAKPVAPGGPRPPPAAPGEPRRTAMKFRLEVDDVGELLGRFGMKNVLRRGRGALEGDLSWNGSPMSLNYPTMNGDFHLDVQSGQFLKADPGLAKLLSVLSLQSLPRRLTLDFRDVFSQGFAFDFVRGDVSIDQGVASTNNLQMKGVNAAVLMEGRADIARETQDLKVVIVPEINAGTASLVATVINPAVGLGTFLAQMFLRDPLMRAATQEFHIDGTWTDPRIAKVSRSQPTASPPVSAASLNP